MAQGIGPEFKSQYYKKEKKKKEQKKAMSPNPKSSHCDKHISHSWHQL
jgi:hypothetical protein